MVRITAMRLAGRTISRFSGECSESLRHSIKVQIARNGSSHRAYPTTGPELAAVVSSDTSSDP